MTTSSGGYMVNYIPGFFYIENAKGVVQLVLDSHVFNYQYKHNNKVSWRCSRYAQKKKSCSAKMFIYGGIKAILQGSHNHESSLKDTTDVNILGCESDREKYKFIKENLTYM